MRRPEPGSRGELRGQAVEKKPTGVAEERADRAAGREPVDAKTGKPIEPPEAGRLERPDVAGPSKDREGLSDTYDQDAHEH
jgi:hypothetical protein